MPVFSRLPCSVHIPSRHSLNRSCTDRAAFCLAYLPLIGYLLLHVCNIIADERPLPAPRPVKLNVFYLPRQSHFLSLPDRFSPLVLTFSAAALRVPLRFPSDFTLDVLPDFPPSVPLFFACVRLASSVPSRFPIESSQPLRYLVEQPRRDACGDCDVFAF